jgi:chromatin remodeling complex protein RSC6
MAKGGAFMKPVSVSDELAKIVGKAKQPRTEITKKLWKYIKKHNLQNRDDKRMIEPDDCLAAVFGSKRAINMMAMTKKVSEHISQ